MIIILISACKDGRGLLFSPYLSLINPATIYVVFSRCVLVRGKAAKCRCSHSTASFANAVRGAARNGLSFDFNQLGTSGMHWHRVAALANGITIAGALRLVPAHA